MRHTGYGLVFVWTSWAVGVWRKSHKTIYGFGPFRFVQFRNLGEWNNET